MRTRSGHAFPPLTDAVRFLFSLNPAPGPISMKTIAIVACILLLFCCILPGPFLAQWVQSADLAGVNIEAMASHGSRVFAGTDGPVYVSTDSGLHWTVLSGSLITVRAFTSNGG